MNISTQVDETKAYYDDKSGLCYSDGSAVLRYSSLRELITDIEIRPGTKTICEAAFHALISLKSITIPDSVERIESEAFWSCDSLENIVLPENCLSIDKHAFVYCLSLKTVTILGEDISVANSAFMECTSLSTVIFEQPISTLNLMAFTGCPALKRIVIADGIPEYLTPAEMPLPEDFRIELGCDLDRLYPDDLDGPSVDLSKLPPITFEHFYYKCYGIAYRGTTILSADASSHPCPAAVLSFVKVIPKRLAYCNPHIEEFYFYGNIGSTNLETIEDEAFYQCMNLETVDLSKCTKLKRIGSKAFANCYALETVILPPQSVDIAPDAFDHCYSLSDVR